MRILCVCDGGNVRSRALAYVLHDLMSHEAIPIGRRWASPETMMLLCNWADRIAVMQPHMAESIPPQFSNKIRIVDVGPDRFGVNIHHDLMQLVSSKAASVLE